MTTYAVPTVALVLPLILALVAAIAARYLRALGPASAALAAAAPLAVGVWALASGASAEKTVSEGSVVWYSVGAHPLTVGWAIDGLAALMLCVVGGVALMVALYSAEYLRNDAGWSRYFALIALFAASMDLLVISNSFVGLFAGWELVGACSYLLIGFWFERPAAADASVKAFLTTRVGDAAFLLGLAVLWISAGTLTFAPLIARLGSLPQATITLAALLIAGGAVGKSAQFPLHAWLPDAMEGPTPVSALIHAATMVAAGVYLVVRVSPLFEAAPAARIVLLMLGAVSAAGAALAACAQTDIKRVLAYSTISQLGFMFAALGAGAWTPAMFHLTTHAAFKALLFLGAGSVIHAAKTQDMHAMGGLRRTMPFTFWTWVVGAAALAGVAPLSGFFSKDEIVASVGSFAPGIGALLLGTALLTAVYITRATMLTFADRRTPARGRESRFLMTAPLAFLAVPAAVLGLAGSAIAELVGGPEVHAPLWLPVVAGALALLGVGLAVAYWRGGVEADVRLEARTSLAWGLAKDGWRWDALVDALVARPTSALSGWLFRVLDRALIDRTVESVAPLARATGRGISRLHTGDGQWYAGVLTVAGALAAIAAVVMSR